jgi:hypothetical protein
MPFALSGRKFITNDRTSDQGKMMPWALADCAAKELLSIDAAAF